MQVKIVKGIFNVNRSIPIHIQEKMFIQQDISSWLVK
jgi:hypothetical protein